MLPRVGRTHRSASAASRALNLTSPQLTTGAEGCHVVACAVTAVEPGLLTAYTSLITSIRLSSSDEKAGGDR